MASKSHARVRDKPLDLAATMRDMGIAARAAARDLARAGTDAKNRALRAMAPKTGAQSPGWLRANRDDLARAKAEGRDGAFLDRLELTPASVEQMAEGLEAIAALEDPVGKITGLVRRP